MELMTNSEIMRVRFACQVLDTPIDLPRHDPTKLEEDVELSLHELQPNLFNSSVFNFVDVFHMGF